MSKVISKEIYINDVRSLNEMILNHRGRSFTVNSIKNEPNVNITLNNSEINHAISELVHRRLVVRVGDKYYTKPLARRRTLRLHKEFITHA
jgi:hypothetical protein